MKRKNALTALCLGVLLCAAVALPAPAASSENALEIYGLDDVEKLLAASKGKVVVFNFFASWCPPCREEIPGLMRIRKDIANEKLVLIGLSIDTDDAALRRYMRATKFNYPVAKSGMDLARAAGVRSIPHMLIFDPRGTVVANQAGYVAEKDLRDFIGGLLE